MKAVDSSVIVAALLDWHPRHPVAVRALGRRPRAVAHALVESFSVLTRLPAPHRISSALAVELLGDAFREAPLVLEPAEYRRLLADAAKTGLSGGAVYDALIARTAARHRAVLLTADDRAAMTYTAVGVAVEAV
jgi:predicted nucleic acid-binding protein